MPSHGARIRVPSFGLEQVDGSLCIPIEMTPNEGSACPV